MCFFLAIRSALLHLQGTEVAPCLSSCVEMHMELEQERVGALMEVLEAVGDLGRNRNEPSLAVWVEVSGAAGSSGETQSCVIFKAKCVTQGL